MSQCRVGLWLKATPLRRTSEVRGLIRLPVRWHLTYLLARRGPRMDLPHLAPEAKPRSRMWTQPLRQQTHRRDGVALSMCPGVHYKMHSFLRFSPRIGSRPIRADLVGERPHFQEHFGNDREP
jgi:hypothetical protein